MDLYFTQTGVQHPLYPKSTGPAAVDPERQKKLRAAKARKQERQRAIDAGEIT